METLPWFIWISIIIAVIYHFWFVCLCGQRRDEKAFHEIKVFKTRAYSEVPVVSCLKPAQLDIQGLRPVVFFLPSLLFLIMVAIVRL